MSLERQSLKVFLVSLRFFNSEGQIVSEVTLKFNQLNSLYLVCHMGNYLM